MAGVNAKVLADGYMPTSLSALYSATATVIVPAGGLVLYQGHTASQSVELHINRDGTTRPYKKLSALGVNYSYVSDERFVLEAGDMIYGSAAATGTVSYVLSGGMEV